MLLIMNICNVEMIVIVGPYNIHVLCEILREIYIFSEMYQVDCRIGIDNVVVDVVSIVH